ncbi:MAG: efflux RND transporter periplasmic adaptor subunit, partial [Pyrinomonadaceae bacterium]
MTTVKAEVRPELRSTVTASGEVRPIQFINLTSEVAGRIEEIYVNPGDRVTKGRPLVRLDPEQLQSQQEAQFAAAQAAISDVQNACSQVTAAENNVSQAQQTLIAAEAAVASSRQQVVVAQTDVDRAQVALNTAQRELKRATDLVESGVQSRAEYDKARDAFEQAEVDLRTARERLQQQKLAIEESLARVSQQKLAVQDSRTGVDRARVSVTASEQRASQQQAFLRGQSSQREKATQYSPLTGVVADIPSRVGQYAIANFQSTPLLTIADMSTINVEVNVDETEIASIEVGQPAKIKVDALGEREIVGTVAQKNPLAVSKSDTTSGGISNRVNVQEAKEFKVVIKLENINEEISEALRPGMSATATVTTKVKKDVLAVPLQAIVEKAPEAKTTPGASSNAQAAALPVSSS